MDQKLIVSSSPHIGAQTKTRNIMLDVIIALIPALIASVIFFRTTDDRCGLRHSGSLCSGRIYLPQGNEAQ